MRKLMMLAGIALLAATVVAISQETPQYKPKPAAGRVAATTSADDTATAVAPARTTANPATTTDMAAPMQGAASQASSQANLSQATAMPANAAQTTLQEGQAAPALQHPDEALSAAAGMMLPVGTTVRMRLETALSTATNKSGDSFAGRVTEPVVLQGKTVVPVGASVEGRVMSVSDPRRIRGVPTLDLKPETVTMPDGQRFALNASIVDTSNVKKLDVDDEGRIKGRGHDGTDWRNAGIGAGAGAGVGALIKHSPKGALVGAGVGFAAATVKWLITRREATVPAGTEIYMELSRPLSLSAAGTAGGR